MRRSAQAKGIQYDITTSNTEFAEDWVFDPDQLRTWHGNLVDSCHAINEQLGQIQNDLRLNPASERTQSLRVVGRV
jgi:hypothetical protein